MSSTTEGQAGFTLTPDALGDWMRRLLVGAKLRPDAADVVTEILLEASTRGVDSHGVHLLPLYLRRLRAGLLNPDPHASVVSEDGAVATVDADEGPGHVATVFALDVVARLAREHGIGIVGVRRSTHFGAAGPYVTRLARQGLVGICMTNAEPHVVPFGGREPALGTNPIAFAAPTADGVFLLDMATSQVALNKIYFAREKEVPIPDDWGVDEEGRATTDPEQVSYGVPLGGYKGYGLALMVEVLSGLLPGAGVRHGVGRAATEFDRRQDVGHFLLALDPERTIGRERFATLLSGMLADLRAIPPAPGFDEVLVAGDREDRIEEERRRSGIPIPPRLWEMLAEQGDALGVAAPDQRG